MNFSDVCYAQVWTNGRSAEVVETSLHRSGAVYVECGCHAAIYTQIITIFYLLTWVCITRIEISQENKIDNHHLDYSVYIIMRNLLNSRVYSNFWQISKKKRVIYLLIFIFVGTNNIKMETEPKIIGEHTICTHILILFQHFSLLCCFRSLFAGLFSSMNSALVYRISMGKK